jgi:hypothetical protein
MNNLTLWLRFFATLVVVAAFTGCYAQPVPTLDALPSVTSQMAATEPFKTAVA